MNKIFKVVLSLITVIVISYCNTIRASAIVYEFAPLSQMYTTTTGTVYSYAMPMGSTDRILYGDLTLGMNISPDTTVTIAIVAFVQESTNGGSSWKMVKTISGTQTFTNTSKTAYDYKKYTLATEKVEFKANCTYKVGYMISHYSGTKSLVIAPKFVVDFP